ncbi:rCG30648, isoform CRA_a [Rattus norvegicus]|uniref:RCG30648, isoform CRA_a n=1 Tax=Rattus norvegicus TaxID=10116 RepID=A6ISD6_RAT|nr:rCG30648, isoform CRA_a [Rattus norvegicus]EDL80487.1 rCG30648, isoform CRA_a [Rattus norvegicus]EDL80488.1 rCG30648, isoform CRA_a [Rattus norvegicus]
MFFKHLVDLNWPLSEGGLEILSGSFICTSYGLGAVCRMIRQGAGQVGSYTLPLLKFLQWHESVILSLATPWLVKPFFSACYMKHKAATPD